MRLLATFLASVLLLASSSVSSAQAQEEATPPTPTDSAPAPEGNTAATESPAATEQPAPEVKAPESSVSEEKKDTGVNETSKPGKKHNKRSKKKS